MNELTPITTEDIDKLLSTEDDDDVTSAFDSKRFYENLTYYIKKTGKKVGELEATSGVSTGYISRLGKDNAPKPSVEFILSASNALGISTDTLLRANCAEINETDDYLLAFIDKMNSETTDNKIKWEKEDRSLFELIMESAGNNEDLIHPLFGFTTHHNAVESDGEFFDLTNYRFRSHYFKDSNDIYDDCFNADIGNNAVLYIMSVGKFFEGEKNFTDTALEIWILEKGKKPYFLCGNKNDKLSSMIDTLYLSIKDYSSRPKLAESTKKIIDEFMSGDGLPFK